MTHNAVQFIRATLENVRRPGQFKLTPGHIDEALKALEEVEDEVEAARQWQATTTGEAITANNAERDALRAEVERLKRERDYEVPDLLAEIDRLKEENGRLKAELSQWRRGELHSTYGRLKP